MTFLKVACDQLGMQVTIDWLDYFDSVYYMDNQHVIIVPILYEKRIKDK